jgi:uroporphyrinogen-III synthase
MANLQRKVVAFLEGRRTAELADLIARHNGVPLAAPCVREVHTPDAPELRQSIQRVLDAPRLDVAVFLTGVGTRTVFESAQLLGREAELRQRLAAATVAVRGPKPTAVLRQLGVRIDITAPPPNTSAELLTALDAVNLDKKTVAVQLYGAPNPELSLALRARGAAVIELAPYVWERPIDPTPVLALLEALNARAVDVLLITSQVQVDHLFSIARERGHVPALDGVAIGAQGPVAEAALERHGLHATFRPEHGHMGALVLAAARHLESTSTSSPISEGVFAE